MFYLLNRRLLVLVALLMLGSLHALGQTARLTGQVTDPDGASLPGATVQLIHQGDLATQTVVADESGAFTALHLSAGVYQVVVKMDGFNVYTSKLIDISEGQAAVLNVQMALATTTQQVTVQSGTSGQITLDDASISGTLSQKEVTSFGLNGRNFSQLITLTPGVSNQSGQDEAKVGVAGSAKFSVNGGRVEYNTFEVDGSDVLNTSINASRGAGQPLMVYPSIDAIQEMQVLTSNYGAMYGKSASGSVIVTTKSGTGKFHGNAYAFIRNEAFNARNYFDQPGRTPLYRRQDYGGTIGGPIYIPKFFNVKKDKTFFFYSEELRLEKTPVDYNQAVPTVAERGGDFSDVCPLITTNTGSSPSFNTSAYPDCPIPYGQAPTVVTGQTGVDQQAISGEHVNVSYIAGAILNTNIIPLPNAQIGCNTTNPTAENRCYNAAVSPATYWREELFRIDHSITPSETLSFRYIHDTWHTTTLTPQWGVVQNSFPTVENYLSGPGLDLVLSLAQTLPHGLFNRIAASFAVENISLAPETGPGVTSLARPAILDNAGPSVTGGAAVAGSPLCSVVTGPNPTPPGEGTAQQFTECPLGHIFNNGFAGRLPGLDFQGNNGAYGGHGFAADTGYAPWSQSNPTYTLRDDLYRQFGKHLVSVGFAVSYSQQNEQSAVSGANSGDLQGLLTFSDQQSKYTTGNAFADFLAGPGLFRLSGPNGTSGQQETTDYSRTAIKSFTQDSGAGRYYNRYKASEFYMQDDWRVTTRFTLNTGIRISLLGQWYNPRNTAYNFEPQAYNSSLGNSIYVDPLYGELVRTTTTGSAGSGSLPTVPLNLGNLDPTITNGLVQCGVNGVPNSCMQNKLFNPGPRVGFAWDPQGNGRISVRAGYGLFWEHGTGGEANTGSLIGSAPLVLSETQTFPAPVNIGVEGAGLTVGGTPSPLAGAYNSIGQVCTANCGLTTGASVSSGTFPLNVTNIPAQAHYSYTQQWSLSVQRELRKNTVGTLAYVGSKGTHLVAVRNLNQLSALPSGLNPFPAGQPLTSDICANGKNHGFFPVESSANSIVTSSPGIGPNQPGYINALVACAIASPDTLRPYTGFSNIISVENIADSAYSGLQGVLKETTGPLILGVTYTWSHSIDDASDRSSANFADSLNIHSNRASSDFDERQLINVSYIYNLPLLQLLSKFTSFLSDNSASSPSVPGKDAKAGAGDSNLLKTSLGDWQLSGITSYQSGTPFSVVNAGGANGTAYSDNAGVGNGLGIGSYADLGPRPTGVKPAVISSGQNEGPLLGNPRRFVAPRALTFGNSGRNYLNNPSRTNFNMALLKNFKVFGERTLEFRTEAFNVFNHTQFRVYDPAHPGNTGNNVVNCYGDITTGYNAGAPSCLVGNSFLHPVDAHDPRILQFGLKLSY